MKKEKRNREIWVLTGLLVVVGLFWALDLTGGRLVRPERQGQDDRWVGFHVVYEPMPPSMDEVEANPEAYPEEDRTHWVEYGSQDLAVEGFGTLAIPREILIGEYQEETGEYSFPGLEGHNAFLVAQTQEDGSQVWGGSYDLADARVKVGGAEQSLSGTIYCGPPVGAGEDWAERVPDYVWRAYNVFQMADGTVYLDGSGNSYGGTIGGMSFSSNATETTTVNGESETTSLTVEVKVENVARLKSVAVKVFDEADQVMQQQEFIPEEAENAHVSVPAECAWVLVEEQYEDGTAKRTAYSLNDWEYQEEIAHSLVLLDQRGMGQAVSLLLALEGKAAGIM